MITNKQSYKVTNDEKARNVTEAIAVIVCL